MKIYLPRHKLWVIEISPQDYGHSWRVQMGHRVLAAVFATQADALPVTNALTWLGFKWEFVSEP
jgi:hypothetical protein